MTQWPVHTKLILLLTKIANEPTKRRRSDGEAAAE